jgi:hypothetical protein
MACGGVYWSGDSSIAAVGPAHADIPCGRNLLICELSGVRCLSAVRSDSCPGCSSVGDGLGERIDLSEAGLDYLAGYAGASVVPVTVQEVKP